MDARAAAEATASAVSAVGSHFMLDGDTYKRGADLGFAGLDFYAAGRGGVLGDVDADVVAAAFAFFEPAQVRLQWEQGTKVLSPREAADAWAACCAAWAEAHVPDELDSARLGELLDQVVAGARPACAAIFSGWRALPVPASPKAHAVHQMNALRELRHGLHSAAVIANGVTPHEALSINSPGMAPIFGWPGLADGADAARPRLQAAEDATNAALAHAFSSLSDSERDEVVELVNALHAATSG
jgi:hypothetical protein